MATTGLSLLPAWQNQDESYIERTGSLAGESFLTVSLTAPLDFALRLIQDNDEGLDMAEMSCTGSNGVERQRVWPPHRAVWRWLTLPRKVPLFVTAPSDGEPQLVHISFFVDMRASFAVRCRCLVHQQKLCVFSGLSRQRRWQHRLSFELRLGTFARVSEMLLVGALTWFAAFSFVQSPRVVHGWRVRQSLASGEVDVRAVLLAQNHSDARSHYARVRCT